jgi:hypothetical protein
VVAERRVSGAHQDHPYWDLDGAHGVAIWFPHGPGDWDYAGYVSGMYRFTVDGQWDEFLDAYLEGIDLSSMSSQAPGLPPMLELE